MSMFPFFLQRKSCTAMEAENRECIRDAAAYLISCYRSLHGWRDHTSLERNRKRVNVPSALTDTDKHTGAGTELC